MVINSVWVTQNVINDRLEIEKGLGLHLRKTTDFFTVMKQNDTERVKSKKSWLVYSSIRTLGGMPLQ